MSAGTNGDMLLPSPSPEGFPKSGTDWSAWLPTVNEKEQLPLVGNRVDGCAYLASITIHASCTNSHVNVKTCRQLQNMILDRLMHAHPPSHWAKDSTIPSHVFGHLFLTLLEHPPAPLLDTMALEILQTLRFLGKFLKKKLGA